MIYEQRNKTQTIKHIYGAFKFGLCYLLPVATLFVYILSCTLTTLADASDFMIEFVLLTMQNRAIHKIMNLNSRTDDG